MRIPDHLTCLLRNLYAGQETTVRTGQGTTHWFQIGKGVHQGYILSPCLFNLYAEYIMRNAGLNEAQAGIKIARRNINNLRYTTLMAESEEELKSLLMRMKEESEKAGLKLNIQKTKIMASSPMRSVQFSCSVVSNSATPRTAAHQASLPSPIPGACSNSCPSSRRCHPTISSSLVPFSSCFRSLPASESFPMNQFFQSGAQSIEYSGLISFRMDWLDLLAVQGTLKSLLQHHSPITS